MTTKSLIGTKSG